ncbi:MAG: prolipoprotein diacylglyceryl transferase family protein [Desulfobacterales bacterium]
MIPGANMLSIGILGAFIAAALTTGIVVLRYEVRAGGAKEDQILDLCFWLLLAAMAGAWLCDAAPYFTAAAAGARSLFRLWSGGSFYYGGAVAALAAGGLFIARRRLPPWKTVDFFGPSLAIGHFLVYIGFFFSGYSIPEPFGLNPNLVLARPGDGLAGALPRPDPIALYLACGSFVIFAVVLIVKGRRKFSGQVFWSFMLLNGALQLVTAGYAFSGGRRLQGGELSPAMVMGALVVAVSLAMLFILERRFRRSVQASSDRSPPP